MSHIPFQDAANQNQIRQKVSILVMGENEHGGRTVLLLERFDRKAIDQETARSKENTWFTFVGGTVEESDESLHARAWIEIEEETGLKITKPRLLSSINISNTLKNDRYPNGLIEHFYMLEAGAYEGTPENVEGVAQGHLSLKAYTIPESLALLKPERVGHDILDLLQNIQGEHDHVATYAQNAVYVGPHPREWDNNIC